MSFKNLIIAAQKEFPNLQIKYKDSSWIMKTLGKLLFFNKDFMTSYTTTIGSTVYFPNEKFSKARPVAASVILLHELIHIYDAEKLNKFLFSFLYLFPQILALLFFPMLFISWKLSFLFLLLAAPIPAYFRMRFEKKAYLTSLYSLHALGKKLNFDPGLDHSAETFLDQFKGSYYYFMWPFGSKMKKDFDVALNNIKKDLRPFEDPIFDILDHLIKEM